MICSNFQINLYLSFHHISTSFRQPYKPRSGFKTKNLSPPSLQSSTISNFSFKKSTNHFRSTAKFLRLLKLSRGTLTTINENSLEISSKNFLEKSPSKLSSASTTWNKNPIRGSFVSLTFFKTKSKSKISPQITLPLNSSLSKKELTLSTI